MFKAYAATEAGGPLKPFEYDAGPLGRQDVEIDVQYCGICHSDLSMLNNDWGFSQYPFVPGHEVAGTVAAVGEDVHNLKPGDVVGLGWHAGYCGTCPSCLSGDHNLCAGGQGTIVGRHGGFADKVRAQATAVIKLPEGLDASHAGPLFCGGITVFNPLEQFDLKPTARAGVIGIGGLGHMALQFLRAWGCEVTAFTSSDSKRDEALKMGAHRTVNSRDAPGPGGRGGALRPDHVHGERDPGLECLPGGPGAQGAAAHGGSGPGAHGCGSVRVDRRAEEHLGLARVAARRPSPACWSSACGTTSSRSSRSSPWRR